MQSEEKKARLAELKEKQDRTPEEEKELETLEEAAKSEQPEKGASER